MTTSKLLVLFYNGILDENLLRIEMDHLTAILKTIDSPDFFSLSNELVNRNRITSDRKKILKEAKFRKLRAFRFFINKN